MGRVVDGRYKVLGRIGAGGMGVVYRVEHLRLGKTAAMKVLAPDTAGKQELDPELVAAASLVVDDAEQAISIGECQHAYRLNLIDRDRLRWTLGAVVSGAFARGSAEEITLFDGTGVALQDLAVAALAHRRAKDRGLGAECDFAEAAAIR